MIVNAEDIRQALAALRYHNRLRSEQVPDYLGSSFEKDSLDGITVLADLYKRMTESNRSDFLGGEL
jgi:hypothetical protein